MSSADVSKRRFRGIGLAAVVVVVVLAAGLTVVWLAKPPGCNADAVMPAEVAELEALQRGFTWMADTIKPSVVFIDVEQKVSTERTATEGPGVEVPQPWRELIPPDFPFTPRRTPTPPTPPVGQGSGVIIDPTGYILTNNHVVVGAEKVTVHLADGGTYPAEVVGTDELTDLAVIKITPKQPLVAAKLGDASEAKVGSWVMAVGYPFGGSRIGGRFDEPLRYEPTVTVGVISATDRQLSSDLPNQRFRDLIQTDASINLGNSGGPLVNIRSQVIGINQAIFTSPLSGGNIGVGFAIPINAHTKDIIGTLKGGEKVVRGQLGVLVTALTDTLRRVYGADHGVFVEEVQPDTAASLGGIKAEDIITTYAGKKVTSQGQFVNWVQNTKPGTTVKIEVLRDTKPLKLEVKLGELSPGVTAEQPTGVEHKRLGLTVEPVPGDQLGKMGIAGGVRVVSVQPLGDGARAGLQEGDVIVKVNREVVTDLESYQRALAQLKKGDPATLRVWRSGHIRTAQIESLFD